MDSTNEEEYASQTCSDAESEYEKPSPSRRRGIKRKRADSILETEATPGPEPEGSTNCGAYPQTGALSTDRLDVVIPVDGKGRHLGCAFRFDDGSICGEEFTIGTDPTDVEKEAVEEHVKMHISRKTGRLPCWQCGAEGSYHTTKAMTLKKHIFQVHYKTTHWRCPFCGKTFCQNEKNHRNRHLKTCGRGAARAAGRKSNKGKSRWK